MVFVSARVAEPLFWAAQILGLVLELVLVSELDFEQG